MCTRLGVRQRGDAADMALADAIVAGLKATTMPLDRFWFDWRGGARRAASVADPTYALPAFAPFVAQVADYAPNANLDHSYWSGDAPCGLPIGEIEAIWARIADTDDWSVFDAKLAAIDALRLAMT